MEEVGKRRRGTSRVSADAEGPGWIVFVRATDVLEEFAGSLAGNYESDELSQLRDEWD